MGPSCVAPHPLAPTSTTSAMPSRCDVSVLGIEGVSVLAVSLPGVDSGESIPAEQVVPVGDRFQVRGLDAKLVSAKVVEFGAWRPHEGFVQQSVNKPSAKRPVTPIIDRPSPDPAVRPSLGSFQYPNRQGLAHWHGPHHITKEKP